MRTVVGELFRYRLESSFIIGRKSFDYTSDGRKHISIDVYEFVGSLIHLSFLFSQFGWSTDLTSIGTSSIVIEPHLVHYIQFI